MHLPTGAASGAHASSSSTGRVLVIDDDPMVARSLALILAAHSVDVVHSGADALARIARGSQYDVILCDVMMPSMTGPEFLARLLVAAPAEAERVVFVTGCALLPEVRRLLDRVSNPCLEKPVNIDALRALVEDRVREARTETLEYAG
jgi:CheY-like chemotaxis protein